MPVVYIDNRGQFLIPFLYIFRGFYAAHIVDRVLSFFSSRRMGLPHIHLRERGWGVPIRTRGQTLGSLGICVLCGTASHENLPNTFCKNSAKHWWVCGRFLMCFPAIYRYRENTWKIVKRTNSIAGEYIPESIKIKNVYYRYRLDSGQTSPAILRLLELVKQKFFKSR